MANGERRVALVTGAYGAIGAAIARGLAAEPGFDVVLVGRDSAQLDRAVAATRSRSAGGSVRGEVTDLSSRSSIEELSARWTGPLHVLVNNAASCPRRRSETREGIEVQLATNILGYAWMTEAFEGVLRASAPSRVVNVASYWAGNLDVEDLEFRRRRYDNDSAYRQSKQANRMTTVHYAERFEGTGVTVNVCHPGDVPSKLSHDLGFGGHESAEQGADTPVWLATSPQVEGRSGLYYAQRREQGCPFGQDRAGVAKLMEALRKKMGSGAPI
jgi:NAD(P)-dependent dehydrogenase (short-subunit alcohol dehydrogenase family)